MIENTRHNRVCSVLFADIVGYSTTTVAEQLVLKQTCNQVLAEALGDLPAYDRVILDTGDGAAVTFLGAPENALFVALRMRGTTLPMRLGVNLGPVRLVTDINGQTNVVGDGINVAQRVMSFCNPGELLVSRSFYEVASRLSTDYLDLFSPHGAHLDKHSRTHEVYTLAPDARARLARAEAEWLQRTYPPRRAAGREQTAANDSAANDGAAPQAPDEPAQVFDAGKSLMISGYSKTRVQEALDRHVAEGARVLSPISQVAGKWVAACENLRSAGRACKVEVMGYTRIITGPTREDVAAKVGELLEGDAVLLRDIECVGGVWTAVCEAKSD